MGHLAAIVLLLMTFWGAGVVVQVKGEVDSCNHQHIVAIYLNSCKSKRSHSAPGKQKMMPSYNVATTMPDSSEVLDILSNGLSLIREWVEEGGPRLGRKKKAVSLWSRNAQLNRRDNEIDAGEDYNAKLWKHLMSEAALLDVHLDQGKKVRRENRDAFEAVYKCCYGDGKCSEKDFVHLC